MVFSRALCAPPLWEFFGRFSYGDFCAVVFLRGEFCKLKRTVLEENLLYSIRCIGVAFLLLYTEYRMPQESRLNRTSRSFQGITKHQNFGWKKEQQNNTFEISFIRPRGATCYHFRFSKQYPAFAPVRNTQDSLPDPILSKFIFQNLPPVE